MSHGTHYDYTQVTVGTHFAPPSNVTIPSFSTTAAQLPISSSSSTGSKFGSSTESKQRQAATVTETVSESVSVSVVHENANASSMTQNHHRFTTLTSSSVWVQGVPYILMVWVPRRDSPSHYKTVPHNARITPTKPTTIKMNVGELSAADTEPMETLIQSIVVGAAKRLGKDTISVKSYMERKYHWDFQQTDKPVIEEVTWETVANKCRNNSIGLKFHEVNADSERVSGQDKLKKIHYVDQQNNITGTYQIIAQPALTTVLQSDKARHQGALLIQDHGADSDNPFIVNSTVETSAENTISGTRGSRVKLHDFYILWGLINMSSLLLEYENRFRD